MNRKALVLNGNSKQEWKKNNINNNTLLEYFKWLLWVLSMVHHCSTKAISKLHGPKFHHTIRRSPALKKNIKGFECSEICDAFLVSQGADNTIFRIKFFYILEIFKPCCWILSSDWSESVRLPFFVLQVYLDVLCFYGDLQKDLLICWGFVLHVYLKTFWMESSVSELFNDYIYYR